jgi:hypothetical protein
MDHHARNAEWEKIVQCVLEVDPPSPEDGTWISPEFLLPRKFYLLSTSQKLLLMRYFLTKGLTSTFNAPEEQWTNWFYLTVGKEILPDIKFEELELFCLLQIVPEFQDSLSLADYFNCFYLSLHSNLSTNLGLPWNLYRCPNLIPYYRYCVLNQSWAAVIRQHMEHVISLARKSTVFGKETLSISHGDVVTLVHTGERGLELWTSVNDRE